MHDVGKVAVPEAVLLTPGGLSFEQYEMVKEHAAVGARIVSVVMSPRRRRGCATTTSAGTAAATPTGLAGEDIPDGAAILCLADSWDAMRRRAWIGQPLVGRRGDARSAAREAGHQFAPWAVDALEAVVDAASPAALARRSPRAGASALQPAA